MRKSDSETRKKILNLHFSLCLSILKSPTPLSFHSFFAGSNLKSLARLTNIGVSSSSPVVTVISSGKGMTGSKCISGPCGTDSSSIKLYNLIDFF